MAKKLAPIVLVTFNDALTSNVYEQEALINLLERKGVITKTELLEEIRTLKFSTQK